MSQLLDQKVAAIVVELEDLKTACTYLDRLVSSLEKENRRKLKETVASLRTTPPQDTKCGPKHLSNDCHHRGRDRKEKCATNFIFVDSRQPTGAL